MGGLEPRLAGADQVDDDVIDHAADDFVDQPPLAEVGIFGGHDVELAAEEAGLAQLIEADQLRPDAVVDVVVVVGDLVGHIGDLRLEAGLGALQETLAEVAQLPRRPRGAMLEDALAALERQVEAGEFGIALLQLIHHPQGLQVVLEPTIRSHALVQARPARHGRRAYDPDHAPGRWPRSAPR